MRPSDGGRLSGGTWTCLSFDIKWREVQRTLAERLAEVGRLGSRLVWCHALLERAVSVVDPEQYEGLWEDINKELGAYAPEGCDICPRFKEKREA